MTPGSGYARSTDRPEWQQSTDYFSLPVAPDGATSSGRPKTPGDGSGDLQNFRNSPTLSRQRTGSASHQTLLDEAAVANQYQRATAYEAEIVVKLQKAHATLTDALNSRQTNTHTEDIDNLLTQIGVERERILASIPVAKEELFTELRKFVEIVGASRQQLRTPSGKTAASLKDLATSPKAAWRAFRRKREEDASSGVSQAYSETETIRRNFETKKKNIFEDFSLQIDEAVIAPAESRIAKHALVCMWTGQETSALVLREHALYPAVKASLISVRAQRDFDELVDVIQTFLNRANQAIAIYDRMDPDEQEEICSFYLFMNDRSDSLRDSIKKNENGVTAVLPYIKESRMDALQRAMMPEADRVLRQKCMQDGALTRNSTYEFLQNVFPQGTAAIEQLENEVGAMQAEVATLQNAYAKLSPKDKMTCKALMQQIETYLNQNIRSVRIALQASQPSIAHILDDLTGEQRSAYLSSKNQLAEKLLKDTYRLQPAEGELFDFIHACATETADLYSHYTAQIAALKGYTAIISKRHTRSDQSGESTFETLVRRIHTAYQSRIDDLTQSRSRMEDVWKKFRETGEPDLKNHIYDLVYRFLEDVYDEQMPSGREVDEARQYSRDAVTAFERDVMHRQNRTGPHLFTEEIDDPEEAELQKSLRDMYLRDGNAWREYEGLIRMNNKVVFGPTAVMDLLANVAEGARGWRQMEGKLLFGAYESALISELLNYVEKFGQDGQMYKQSAFYEYGLRDLNDELKSVKSEQDRSDLTARFDTNQKKRFDNKLRQYRGYIADFERHASNRDPALQRALTAFADTQRHRIRAALYTKEQRLLARTGDAVKNR